MELCLECRRDTGYRALLSIYARILTVGHNHPSGVAEPSGADRQITQKVKQALELIDVRVLDHFIIGGLTHTSFAERGLMPS